MHKNRAENFAGQKRAKTAKRTRKSQKKAKPGAFWVLEGVAAVGGGCGRILLLEKCTTMAWWWPQQQKDLPAFLTKRYWLELPLKGAPSRRSSLKTCHRHVFLTLGPSRVQVLPRSNEKSQASQKRYLTFLAGAEGLEPSARGFGVDVGKRTGGTGEGQCCPVLPNKSQKSGAGLVLTPDFAAIRLSFGLRIDSRLAGKILDNLSIGKDDLSFAIGGNVLVMGD